MARRWLILADDLTGAADCAIAFARRGRSTCVQWGEAGLGTEDDVVSHDADSRQLDPEAAAARHAALVERLHYPGRSVFKKIDSTLRGQPAAELAATLVGVRGRGAAFAILAPAFPATGRTTRDGRIVVEGRPLEETELWRRDHTYATGSLPAMLAEAGLRSATIDLATVRAGTGFLHAALAEAARAGAVAVLDVESDDDLARIAEAGLTPGLPEGLVWVGSAGLAHALAAQEPAPAFPAPKTLSTGSGGTLVVVGSLAAASRAAARRLAGEPGLRHIPVTPELLLAGDAAERARWRDPVTADLIAGDDVLVEVAMGEAPDLALGPRLADALGALLGPVAPHLGGLVATGGETAASLLTHLGVDGLRLIDEIEAGVSLGLTRGALRVPIVTKAGAFGTPETLVRAVHHLRAIRNQGSST